MIGRMMNVMKAVAELMSSSVPRTCSMNGYKVRVEKVHDLLNVSTKLKCNVELYGRLRTGLEIFISASLPL